SIFDSATKHLAAETLASMVGENIPYLSEQLRLAGVEKPFSRLCLELFTNVNFKDPRTFIGREVPLFAFFDTEIYGRTQALDYKEMPKESNPPPELEQEIIRAKKDFGTNLVVESPSKITKRVLIYHSHYWESFLPELSLKKRLDHNATDVKCNVTHLGRLLVHRLAEKGIGAEQRFKIFSSGNAYANSRRLVEGALKQHKQITYAIDIHRDSNKRDVTTCKAANGQSFAKVYFVVGKASKYYEQNLKLATDLHAGLIKRHPDLSRGIYVKPRTKTSDGEYNQSLLPGAILIEAGGYENNFAEVERTLCILADVLASVIKKQN
ncbi:MAG: hypothetical protein RLZ12_727, partial [Bacillota bacterium]